MALALGLAVRLVALSAHSLLLDEAFVAVGARDMLVNHTPMWDAISNAPFVWMLAHLIGTAGLESPFTLRLLPALFGTASVIPFYFLGRRLFGNRIAGAASVVFALHPFAVAFSRILFADPFQVFFILCGWLVFDEFATEPIEISWKRTGLFLATLGIWALAFLMKYNAVVPGTIWLIAGVLAGRYLIRSALLAFVLMSCASLLTLAMWPYDAPVWFAAFLEKGGSYDLPFAAFYFQSKLRLVFFGVTELALLLGLFFALTRNGRTAGAFGHLTLFVLIYLISIVFLGRTFERYLLILVPVACLLVSSLVLYLYALIFQASTRLQRLSCGMVSIALSVLFVVGMLTSYRHYVDYLRNDIDHAALARDAIGMERAGHIGFWYLPEPIGAYYLGYSRYYSRSTPEGHLYHGNTTSNYFEGQSVPYELETAPFGVLEVRKLLRTWGLWQSITSSVTFLRTAALASETAHDAPRRPAEDYLTSGLVTPGSLLVIESGFRELQGEPILEDIREKDGPPIITHLPTDRFEIVKAYRPEGPATVGDTTIDRIRAGAWILIRK